MAGIEIRRALLSVSDKSGLVELGRGLIGHGVEILSTGGTYRVLKEADLPVTEISEYTGFPEMLDGRVKTLHPKVHGGILHRRDLPDHIRTIAEHGIEPIDLVVVNLYPFERTVAKPEVRREEAIEQIDIGGPSMIRSAAKNHSHVAVLTDPEQYGEFLAELEAGAGKISEDFLRRLATAAFERTARYDRAIHEYLVSEGTLTEETGAQDADLPACVGISYELESTLRYGENPHQKAALYVDPNYPAATAVSAKQLHGKELSYNNLLDLDAALSIAREFEHPAAIVIKHNNPCGAALADRLVLAFTKAYAGDPKSAFGSVLGFNRPIDEETAMAITEPGRFVEAIISPGFSSEALEVLTTRPTWKKNVRLLETGDLSIGSAERLSRMQNRPLEGGLLRQSADHEPVGAGDPRRWMVATEREPSTEQLRDLDFAWVMVKHVRSNAIVLVKEESLVGVGAGQMSRVDATDIAIRKSEDRCAGSVLASDAFFPFRDSIDAAAESGIVAIIQPGGSKRDQDVTDACNEHGIAMLHTAVRHFKH